jgi:hypothetical protein
VAWFDVQDTLVGDGRAWDQFRINDFPSHAAFDAVVADPDRKAGEVHRNAGLFDSYSTLGGAIFDTSIRSDRHRRAVTIMLLDSAMQYTVTATIAAGPEALWALLTDAEGFPAWNPTVTKIEGRIALGNKLKVWTAQDPKRAFGLKVVTFDAPTKMVWSGGMGPLFNGTRTYSLEPGADGTTVFTMTEVFTGWMLGLIKKSMPDLQPAFDDFAAALKKKAEAG